MLYSSEEASETAACTMLNDTAMAYADLPNAKVQVSVVSPEADENFRAPQAGIVDLITVTGGWDDTGRVTGTLELVVDGMFDENDGPSRSEATFRIAQWKATAPMPGSIWGFPDPNYTFYTYDIASVTFEDQNDDEISSTNFTRGTGISDTQSTTASRLHASLSIPWIVRRAQPSFYIMVTASAGQYSKGKVDFKSAKASLNGPEGFQYVSTNGFGVPPTDGPVDLVGSVQTADGTDICALVLANGQYMFTCDPQGSYVLTDLPRDGDGKVTRQVYADGFFPRSDVLPGSVTENVVLEPANNCPNYNQPTEPVIDPDSAGKQISITGRVLQQNSQIPVCALVLANGAHAFSCDGSGGYALDFPLDDQGQYTLQVYAEGFAPNSQILDEFSSYKEVRMANYLQCQK
ncbi:MAG: hypothetical protein R3E50_09310 [Halioglobus sp.]